ncbi:hypothetical protein PoB_007558300 [Plakobranchus ocellatus]|uniref:Uncharacterized protein n=1 Tax=Plakobranchus ocellatus TaxID=259542 RepID=A0AAV4DXJ0_9GAST|nr:hypothetical protein PoB_007558300 [Plakobranchus ocellatus]
MERHKRERYIRDKYGKYYKITSTNNNSSGGGGGSCGAISNSASSHSISSNCSNSSNCSSGSGSSSKLDRWSLHQIRRDDQSQWYHSYTCPAYDNSQVQLRG